MQAAPSMLPDPGSLEIMSAVCCCAHCGFLSLGMQDDHRLSTSELEKKYGTSIDKVSAQASLRSCLQAPLASPGLPEQEFHY